MIICCSFMSMPSKYTTASCFVLIKYSCFYIYYCFYISPLYRLITIRRLRGLIEFNSRVYRSAIFPFARSPRQKHWQVAISFRHCTPPIAGREQTRTTGWSSSALAHTPASCREAVSSQQSARSSVVMKTLLCALAGAILLIGAKAETTPPNSNTQLIASSSNQFGRKLYQEVANGQGNTVVCPLSLYIALSLLKEGTDGKSKSELEEVLSARNASASYKSLLNSLEGNTLQIATKIYPATSFNVNPEFLKVAQDYYQSDVQKLDYHNPTLAAETINKYVEEKTNNKIHELIKPDAITDLTRLILVNAIYFNARWKHVFEQSYESNFHISETETVPATFMSQTGYFQYKDDTNLDAKVLKMDYTTEGYSMIFVLPNKKTGLTAVEEKLVSLDLEGLMAGLKEHRVDVTIPKFEISTTLNLKDSLVKMGIKDIFSSKADLSKLATPPESLYVSDVIQKTYIKVHENGTEAAAATVGYVELLSAPSSDERTFLANRPLFFSIINKNTGVTLVKGKLTKPARDPENVVYPEETEQPVRIFEKHQKGPVGTQNKSVQVQPYNHRGQNEPAQPQGAAQNPNQVDAQGKTQLPPRNQNNQFGSQNGARAQCGESSMSSQPGSRVRGNLPQCGNPVGSPNPQYGSQGSVPSNQYGSRAEVLSSQAGIPSSQAWVPSSKPEVPNSQAGDPSSQFGSQAELPSRHYGGQAEVPSSQARVPSSQYGSRVGASSSQLGSRVGVPSSTQYGISDGDKHPYNEGHGRRTQQSNYQLGSQQDSQDYPNDEPKKESSEENVDRSAPFGRVFFILYNQGKQLPLSPTPGVLGR